MEAIHGRQSLGHNFLSAGILGYVGAQSGRLGVPGILHSHFRKLSISPPQMAFMFYGSIAGMLAFLGGKTP
jgi:hypothetical protein